MSRYHLAAIFFFFFEELPALQVPRHRELQIFLSKPKLGFARNRVAAIASRSCVFLLLVNVFEAVCWEDSDAGDVVRAELDCRVA